MPDTRDTAVQFIINICNDGGRVVITAPNDNCERDVWLDRLSRRKGVNIVTIDSAMTDAQLSVAITGKANVVITSTDMLYWLVTQTLRFDMSVDTTTEYTNGYVKELIDSLWVENRTSVTRG